MAIFQTTVDKIDLVYKYKEITRIVICCVWMSLVFRSLCLELRRLLNSYLLYLLYYLFIVLLYCAVFSAVFNSRPAAALVKYCAKITPVTNLQTDAHHVIYVNIVWTCSNKRSMVIIECLTPNPSAYSRISQFLSGKQHVELN